MVNNFNDILEFAKNIKYSSTPVLLIYLPRKQDHTPEKFEEIKNDRIYKFLGNMGEIDMNLVKTTCKERGCRCYIMFMDNLVMKVLSKIKLSQDSFRKYLDEEMSDSSGLHLIDIDNIRDLNLVIGNLKSFKKRILCVPSRSGYSIVFKSKVELLTKLDSMNPPELQSHLVASINLYIPD